jgi:hypothetical protein
MADDDRAVWRDYQDGQRFEHELINRKTTWWLTAQALLFTAYGVTLRTDAEPAAIWFRDVVAAAGVALAVITLVGVVAVIVSKVLAWRTYATFFARSTRHLPPPLDGAPLQWGVCTLNTVLTLAPDVLQPIILGVAWLVLL